MTFQNPSRRAALYALPALAAAPFAIGTEAAATEPGTDPVLIARDAWADAGQTEVEQLYSAMTAAQDAANAEQDEETASALCDEANRCFIAVAQARPVTPRDVALQALTVREYLDGNGTLTDHVLHSLERTAGQATA